MSIAKTQTSESFRLSALLSFSGGLQDAYTYNVRDGVFANAQTGNVVLMSQNFMQGEWNKGLHYMLPLLSFAAGIFLAERIESRFKTGSKIHWRQIILFIEIAMLLAVGFMPTGLNMLANIMVSFSCAMQVQTFRKVHGYGYASSEKFMDMDMPVRCVSAILGAVRKACHSISEQKRRDPCIRHCISLALFLSLPQEPASEGYFPQGLVLEQYGSHRQSFWLWS